MNKSVIKPICLTLVPLIFNILLAGIGCILHAVPFMITTGIVIIINILYTIYCFGQRHFAGYFPICISCFLTLTCIYTIINSFTILNTAQSHGMYSNNMTISEIEWCSENSPVEDNLPDNIKNSIIIYYRFGCKDCEAVYPELSAEIANKKNIYWVSTESEQGKKLLKSYPVTSVPTGIYIHNNSTVKSPSYTQKSLYINDKNTVLDRTNLERLLYLQEQNR